LRLLRSLECRRLVLARQRAFVETIEQASDALSLQFFHSQAQRQSYNYRAFCVRFERGRRALRAMRWFRLKGFIILKSSANHYHVVFDRSVTWERNMHIIAWVSLESDNSKLQRYLTMQCIKESSTLRLSAKREKTAPRIVFRIGKQDHEIRNYLFCRDAVNKIKINSPRVFESYFRNVALSFDLTR